MAGCLTLRDTGFGLRGPMPRTIAPVGWGRCHATPNPVSEGAPSDRHARGVVTGGLWIVGGQRFLPLLRAPQNVWAASAVLLVHWLLKK
ncbi:hypothetical protein [Mycobacterium gastri]|uniref:Uncharacterized protein n=1 Tax=Mycobacterium gastri TaxID=1777 RepID=A0A1X1VAL6_MYCGS|nr:hypothetical protein [Mycobacterium gastri]ETW23207.1 hypothetical protein MGAST_15425 [Mycobacterium gastri 'Wayne']ORV66106.1 hypothetical protein AWC07_12080 [Mycobacterium gastri]